MRIKWLFYKIALSYKCCGVRYYVTFLRFDEKETCDITRISGLVRSPIKCHRTAFEMLKLHFTRCKRYHGCITVAKVFYINNVRFTSDYKREL